MAGFDCEFVENPPEYLQTHCPMCLLVLREPHQVTCCGKSFCKECIGKIMPKSQPCPTCKQGKFESFPNKGLQQPLYGFRVFCSNKESGCAWEGELGQLDQHINSNPDKEKQLVGCGYTNVSCVYCEEQHQRQKIEEHQASLCVKRPYICPMCKEYESTFDDVMNSHAPVCKCRPVECPNSCGADNLQHQHLEEHVSSQCPLILVECEFSEAGCAAKVYRKDLPSHLTDNIVTHMSLLAKENRKLKLQLKEQQVQFEEQREVLKETMEEENRKQLEEQRETMVEENRKLRVQLEVSREHFKKRTDELKNEHMKFNAIFATCLRQPPIDFVCSITFIQGGNTWSSDVFRHRIHKGVYDMRLCAKLTHRNCLSVQVVHTTILRKSDYVLSSKLRVMVILLDQKDYKENLDLIITATEELNFNPAYEFDLKECHIKNNGVVFRIANIS